MLTPSREVVLRAVLLGALAFIYFVVFPEDLDGLLNPVAKLLALSNLVSPWLYAVVGVVIVAWAVVRVCGSRSRAEPDRAVPARQ